MKLLSIDHEKEFRQPLDFMLNKTINVIISQAAFGKSFC